MSAPSSEMLTNSDFGDLDTHGVPVGWELLTPSDTSAPRLQVVRGPGGTRWAKLAMKKNGGCYGNLRQRVEPLTPGQWVRVRCTARAAKGVDPRYNALVRLIWYDEKDRKIVRQYLDDTHVRARVSRLDWVARTPDEAKYMEIHLIGRWAKGGWVSFGELSMTPTDAPPERRAKLAVVQLNPRSPTTPDKNRRMFAEKVAEAGRRGADLVVLGEGITVVATGKKMSEVAEPVPGPTTRIIGAQAKKHGLYVVVGIYERDGDLLYNTAVLIGRDGSVVGKYRKVHLPEGETDQGLIPGAEHPVFETDFAKIGIQICYDYAFPESARLLTLNGAEIIACPIWGSPRAHGLGWESTARARALENGVFFVGAIYGPRRGLIMDPDGDILADADGKEGVYVAEIDLTPGRYTVDYDEGGRLVWRYFKHVYRKERMPQTYRGMARW
ncbi:MAG: carbon-nitrogen hydrolase family protein [Armatimonadota bacterium]